MHTHTHTLSHTHTHTHTYVCTRTSCRSRRAHPGASTVAAPPSPPPLAEGPAAAAAFFPPPCLGGCRRRRRRGCAAPAFSSSCCSCCSGSSLSSVPPAASPPPSCCWPRVYMCMYVCMCMGRGKSEMSPQASQITHPTPQLSLPPTHLLPLQQHRAFFVRQRLLLLGRARPLAALCPAYRGRGDREGIHINGGSIHPSIHPSINQSNQIDPPTDRLTDWTDSPPGQHERARLGVKCRQSLARPPHLDGRLLFALPPGLLLLLVKCVESMNRIGEGQVRSMCDPAAALHSPS